MLGPPVHKVPLIVTITFKAVIMKSELPYELQLLYVSTPILRNISEFISQVRCLLCLPGNGISMCEQPCACCTTGNELNHAQQRTDRQNRGPDSYITIQLCVCVVAGQGNSR